MCKVLSRGLNPLGLIVPTGVGSAGCHVIKLYQDGVYLGEAYYSGILMPDE